MNDGILVKLADVECVTEETVVNVSASSFAYSFYFSTVF